MRPDMLAARFREAAGQDPAVKALALSHAEPVKAAQEILREEARRIEAQVGLPEAEVRRIAHGVTPGEGAADPKRLQRMQGQTEAMAIHALKTVITNTPDDLPSESIARFTGRQVPITGGHYALTTADLETGIERSARTLLADRECAVILNELMRREAAAGRTPNIDAVLARMAPAAPSPEELSRLTPQERDAALDAHQAKRAEFELTAKRIRRAYEAHAGNRMAAAAGDPTLNVLPDHAAAALVAKLAPKALGTKLDAGASLTDAEKRLPKPQREAAEARCRTVNQQSQLRRAEAGKSLATLAQTLSGPADPAALSAQKRAAAAELSDRAARGGYVLMTKLHDASKPSGGGEFLEAWDKLELKPTDAAPGAVESVRRSIALGAAPEMGGLARAMLAAEGTLNARDAREVILGNTRPEAELAFRTAAHCAVEATAANLGTTTAKLLARDLHWQGTVPASSVTNVPADQTAVRAVLAAPDAQGNVRVADLIGAHMKTLLPASATEGVMEALMADRGAGAAKMSRSLLFRNEALRKAKYFEGLAGDVTTAIREGRRLRDLRGVRSELMSERMRGFYGECLANMEPGASIAIDKAGHVTILGAEMKKTLEGQRAGEAEAQKAALELSAEVGVDLTDALVITKKTDGGVSLSVTKGAGVSASASAKAAVSAGRSFEAGALAGEVSFGAEASAAAGLSLGGSLAVERDMSVRDAAHFLDRLLNGRTTEADLSEAVLAATISAEATISVGVSASAALGFETAEAEETIEPASSETLADGTVLERAQSTDEDGAVTEVVTATAPDGSSVKTTTVRDESGAVTASSVERTDRDGNVLKEAVERGVSTAFSEGWDDPAGKLNVSASVGLALEGGVSCSCTSRTTPTQKQTEYAFEGHVTLSARANASHEGLSALGALAGAEPSLEAKSEATWNVATTYGVTESRLSGAAVEVTKAVSCRIMDPDEGNQANVNQVRGLVAAQGMPQASADALTTLLLLSDVRPSSVTFEAAMTEAALSAANARAGRGGVGVRHVTNPADYALTGITLGFEASRDNAKLLTRAVNFVAGGAGGAVEHHQHHERLDRRRGAPEGDARGGEERAQVTRASCTGRRPHPPPPTATFQPASRPTGAPAASARHPRCSTIRQDGDRIVLPPCPPDSLE